MTGGTFGTLKKMEVFCEISRDLGLRADGFRWFEAVSETGVPFLIRAREKRGIGERAFFSGYGACLPLTGRKRGGKTDWTNILLSGTGDSLRGECGKGRIVSVLHDGGDDLSYVNIRPDRRDGGLICLIRKLDKRPEIGDEIAFSGPVVSFPADDAMVSFMPACAGKVAAILDERGYAGECLLKLADGSLDYADVDFSRIRSHSQLLSLAIRAVSVNAWNIRLLDRKEFTDSEYAEICMSAREEREGLLLMDAVKFARGASIGDYIAICADLLKNGEPAEWVEENIEWGLLTRGQAAKLREDAGLSARPAGIPARSPEPNRP